MKSIDVKLLILCLFISQILNSQELDSILSKSTENELNESLRPFEGKYFSIDRELCKNGNYWECYSCYVAIDFKTNYLISYFPAISTNPCGIMYNFDYLNSYLENSDESFPYSDTFQIDNISSELISFKYIPENSIYSNPIKKVPVINLSFQNEINTTIGVNQQIDFLAFNLILIEEGLFSKEEIVSQLKKPRFEQILNYEIEIIFPKKWKKKLTRKWQKLNK